jgi:hypothetical protein
MKACNTSVLFLCVTWLALATAHAHTWQSAADAKTLEATFVALKGKQVLLQKKEGKPQPYALELFTAEDQQFAHVAQRTLEQGLALGLKTFQISQPLDQGALATLGSEMVSQKGKWIFTGERFFLLSDQAALLQRDQRMDAQQLYPCGTRSFCPLEGEPCLIQAYSLDLEIAAKWQQAFEKKKGGGLAPEPELVMEPIIEIALTYGMGLPVAKQLIVTDLALVKDMQSMVMHVEQKDVPLTVVKVDRKLGIAVLSHSETLEPGRFALRKEPELGQNIYHIGLELVAGRKGFLSSPSVTKGIVSRLKGRDEYSFQHDAACPPYAIGSYVLSEKGDVLGVQFTSLTYLIDKATGRTLPTPLREVKEGEMMQCLRTDALEKALTDVPGSVALRALSDDDLPQAIKALRASSVIVVATQELRRNPPPKKKAEVAKVGPANAPTGFSISKSGVRHNAQCKFYRAEFPCGKVDGRPCKVCGG